MKVFEQFKREMADTGLHVLLELRPSPSDEVRLSKVDARILPDGTLVSVLRTESLHKSPREDVAEIVHRPLSRVRRWSGSYIKDPCTRKIDEHSRARA